MVDTANGKPRHQAGVDFLECNGCGALTLFPWDGFAPSHHDGPYPVAKPEHRKHCRHGLDLSGLVFAQRAQFEGAE